MGFRELGIPQQPQRQDSLNDQLRDLHVVATRLGCYDAADWILKHIRETSRLLGLREDGQDYNEPSMKLTELQQTCPACPSQWEGRLEDGRYVYARFRWGGLRVTAAPTLDEAITGDLSQEGVVDLCFEQISDGLDGYMDTEDMLRHAGLEPS